MAKIFIEESSLTALGNAIREKTGETALLSPAEMVTAIGDITTGGGGADLPEEVYAITENCSYRFAYNGWNWFLENYGSKVTTKDITNCQYMFTKTTLTKIPFAINATGVVDCTNMFSSAKISQISEDNMSGLQGKIGAAGQMFYDYQGTSIPSLTFNNQARRACNGLFQYCQKVEEIGTITNLYCDTNISYLFAHCKCLRELPAMENFDTSYIQTYKYGNMANMFLNDYSLRSVPESLLAQLCQPTSTSYYNLFLSNMFDTCSSLDEVKGVSPITGAVSSGGFLSNTVNRCSRLKEFTFAVQEDGTPYTAQWKGQVLALQGNVGWADTSSEVNITNYNSGITKDKKVTDDATYQALKDDPDWYTLDVAYSRYNHDSAVNTINSLPDTSAYGTNNIKFKGEAGSATDGGAINTLTEEEIAVATVKGWTVAFA